MVDFIVADGCVILRAPVDDVFSPIDQSLLIETDEHFPHSV